MAPAASRIFRAPLLLSSAARVLLRQEYFPMHLRTARLFLRPITPSDAPALFAARGDPEVMRFWDWPAQESPAELEQVIRGQEEGLRGGRMLWWAVALSPGGPAIGDCDLSEIDSQHGRTEVGFLFARAHWGKDYAREAMEAVLAHSFDRLGLKRLSARVHDGNKASINLLERLGFVPEGRLRSFVLREGERRDCLLYGLVRG
jgi:RimJ/RimL family protein N-acetyltransferase